ncbi:unnamed protein product, partial [marine sediment metagenome]
MDFQQFLYPLISSLKNYKVFKEKEIKYLKQPQLKLEDITRNFNFLSNNLDKSFNNSNRNIRNNFTVFKNKITEEIDRIKKFEYNSLKKLEVRIQYYKKMQIGKEYPFIIHLAINKNLIKLFNLKGVESVKYTIEPPIVAKKGFRIRLVSPSMRISPITRIVPINQKQHLFSQIIYFKLVPEYCGDFNILVEFMTKDYNIFDKKLIRVKVQKAGIDFYLPWICKKIYDEKTSKIKSKEKVQITGSFISFCSILTTIFVFFYSNLLKDIFYDYWQFLILGLFYFIILLSYYFYSKLRGNNPVQKSKIENIIPKGLN